MREDGISDIGYEGDYEETEDCRLQVRSGFKTKIKIRVRPAKIPK